MIMKSSFAPPLQGHLRVAENVVTLFQTVLVSQEGSRIDGCGSGDDHQATAEQRTPAMFL